MKYDSVKDKLIELYCSKDRPSYKHPTDCDGYWVATNVYVAVLIPHTVIAPAGAEKAFAIDKVMASLKPITPSVYDIPTALSQCEKVDDYDEEYKECSVCGGTGICQCSCGDSHCCMACTGEGEKLFKKTLKPEKVYGIMQVVSIAGISFYPSILEPVLKGYDLLQLKEPLVIDQKNKTTLCLSCEGIRWLICGCTPGDAKIIDCKIISDK